MIRVCFFASDKPRERLLADAFTAGAAHHGAQVEVRAAGPEADVSGVDVGCVVGVKSAALIERLQRAGAAWMMFDKGYVRERAGGSWRFWRVAINAHHPTDALPRTPDDPSRWAALNWDIAPRLIPYGNPPIVFAGSSAKYHEFHHLSDPTAYAKTVVKAVRGLTDAPLIYRPKPSWKEAVPVNKAIFSRAGALARDLNNARALITHGSNACFEAMMAGVPTIVLGDGVTRDLSSRRVEDVLDPKWPTDAERLQLARRLAHWQWTHAEMASGSAWAFLKERLYG